MKKLPTHKRLAPLGLILAAASVANAGYTPVALNPSSYNADVVVESNAAPVLKVVTTASVDNGTNNTANTWFEAGFDTANPGNGLPAAGTIFTASGNANYSFQMPPSYTAPNGILIDTVVTSGTWTLTTPAAYNLLSFLGSGGNGGDVIGVRVNHADGTFETGSFGCPDWFNGTLNLALTVGGRCNSTVNLTPESDGANPRMYFRDVVLTNTTSPVTNIVLSYSSGGAGSHNDIVAVSGATTPGGLVSPITVTGYTYDFVVEASAAKRGIVSATVGAGAGAPATTQTMDNTGNTANTWYEQGYNFNNFSGSPHPSPTDNLTGTGIPAAGSTVSDAGPNHTYVMPPSYTTNDACYLSTTITSNTIAFASPTSAAALSFLASAGNGPATPMIVVHHQDGFLETNSIIVPDWFNNTPAFVIGANGRVAADTGQFDVRNNANADPRLFACDVVLLADTNSAITSVDFYYTNTGGRIAIFAVSSTTTVPPIFLVNPLTVASYAGSNITFTALAAANAPISYRWQKGTNGTGFVNLSDGGNISGSTTTNLTVGNIGDADEADYRVVATDLAGSVNSAIATLTVLSALPDVVVPGDPIVAYQPNGGSSPAAESVDHAIDHLTSKYLNFGANGGSPFRGPVGFVVSPADPTVGGLTRVSVIRLTTANDAPERDPANVILEGSRDGGATYSLITSNAVTLPDGRNDTGLPLDPTTQFIKQVKFVNAVPYTSYRWSVTKTKDTNAANSMQIGEVELLGTKDNTGFPYFTSQPASLAVYVGSSASLTVTATGTPTPGLYWQKGHNGVFANLSDGGDISGSQTGTLTINPAAYTDAADYRCVCTNSSGGTTSAVATVTVVSTGLDVTQPGDPIISLGDQSGAEWGANANPANAIDDLNAVKYQNGGSGLNASAGFPPFGGPVGVVVTPSVGATRLTGLRIYTADANPERDPADYTLKGSTDGANYTTISTGALSLPPGRSNTLLPFDPINQPMQEILFSLSAGYTSYSLTFNHTVNDNLANSLQIGELELLGVSIPTLTIAPNGSGGLVISSSQPGTLQSTTNLQSGGSIWVNVGPITGTITVTPAPGVPVKFYRVSVP